LKYANPDTEVTDNWLFKHEEGISEYQEFLTEGWACALSKIFSTKTTLTDSPNARGKNKANQAQTRALKASQNALQRFRARMPASQRLGPPREEGRQRARDNSARLVARRLAHAILTFNAAAAGGVPFVSVIPATKPVFSVEQKIEREAITISLSLYYTSFTRAREERSQ